MSCCNTNTINDQTLYDRMSVGGVFEIGEYRIANDVFYYETFIDFKRGGGMYDNETGERIVCLHNLLMNGSYEFLIRYYAVCDGMPMRGEKWRMLKVSAYGLSECALKRGIVASICIYNTEGEETLRGLLMPH